MALAIEARPTRWEQVIGQERVVRCLQSILSSDRFTPRGFIFEGPSGVGKTTLARILARAIMCNHEPLGCGVCDPCKLMVTAPDHHPDYLAVDAASNSGVDAARRLVEVAAEIPTFGKLRVIIVDEAHRLSNEAWEVFLAPLESRNLPCVFIFCTTNGTKIPKPIRGRCCLMRFSRVSTDAITGLLASLSGQHGISYELDGLKRISRASRGHVRDALNMLEKFASSGPITSDLVALGLDHSQQTLSLNTWVHIAAGRMTDAIECLDLMAKNTGPAKAIEEMFSTFGRAVIGDPDATEEETRRYSAMRVYFPDPIVVTSTLLKWSGADRVPFDALPLFLYELQRCVNPPETKEPERRPPAQVVHEEPQTVPEQPIGISSTDMVKILGASIVN